MYVYKVVGIDARMSEAEVHMHTIKHVVSNSSQKSHAHIILYIH